VEAEGEAGMKRVESLRKNLMEDLGCQYEARGVQNFLLVACAKIEEFARAVQDEEWEMIRRIDVRGFRCTSRENAISISKTLGEIAK
jgi:hypothetical protein